MVHEYCPKRKCDKLILIKMIVSFRDLNLPLPCSTHLLKAAVMSVGLQPTSTHEVPNTQETPIFIMA